MGKLIELITRFEILAVMEKTRAAYLAHAAIAPMLAQVAASGRADRLWLQPEIMKRLDDRRQRGLAGTQRILRSGGVGVWAPVSDFVDPMVLVLSPDGGGTR